jgi:hypothetical protein
MPARNFRRKVLLQLALLPVLLVLVEIGVRLYTGWDAARARAELLELASSMHQQTPDPYEELQLRGYDFEALDEKLLLHPYYGWDKRGSLEDLALDVAYFREADETLDVLVLGGSVAARFKREGEPRLVELMLRDERSKDLHFRFHNYARGGFKQPQQACELIYLLSLGFSPDVVINIDGFNEIFLSLRNARIGIHPVYPSSSFWSHFAQGRSVDPQALDLQLATWELQREAQQSASRALSSGYLRSAALGGIILGRIRRMRTVWAAAQESYTAHISAPEDLVVRGPSCGKEVDEVLELAVHNWAASSRSMHGICAQRGIEYLHVLQPTLADAGSKVPTEDELRALTSLGDDVERIGEGYRLLREAGKVLRSDGVHFVDATDLFAREPGERYVDHCHFGLTGNEELAERIANALLAAL